MSFAYMALFTGDYLRDTRHLTPLRHGVYLLLLMHCWDTQGPLPLDEQVCAGIANCRSADEVEALRYILGQYFVQMEDGYYNKRMQRQIEYAQALSEKRKRAGYKGFQALAGLLPGKSRARAPTPYQTIPTPTPPPKRSKTLSGKVPDVSTLTAKKDHNQTARRVIDFLNEKTGRHYQPVKANLEMIAARLRDGASETELRQVIAKKTREWQGDQKMNQYLRPATLFNRTKFAQYQGELIHDPHP